MMHPLLQAALGAILRSGLTFGAGFLVQRGIWQQGEADQYVGGLTIFALTLGWSLWEKSRTRQRFLDALAAPNGTDERDLEKRP